VDVVVFCVDGADGIGRGDFFIAKLLEDVQTPVIAVLNKIDRMGKPRTSCRSSSGSRRWATSTRSCRCRRPPVSGVEVLVDLIVARMPEGPPYFPSDQVTDQTPDQIIAEIVREKAITLMREEVPHSIAVVVEDMGRARRGTSPPCTPRSTSSGTRRRASSSARQGSGAARHRLTTPARRSSSSSGRVFLDLRVKLMKEWQRDPKKLERLGY
jgi:GTPase